jgi:peptidoglycan/xylan/chitin deacetylase (PgdA/CDA1 family)
LYQQTITFACAKTIRMLCLTHDVDGPFERGHFALFHEIVRRPLELSPTEALSRFRLMRQGRPNWFFLPELLEIERSFDVRSTFFLKADQENYDIDDLKSIIRDLDSKGFEIGHHASIRSAFDMSALGREKKKLESIVGHPIKGVRHDFLTLGRKTWDFHKSVGFEYDGSLGYRNEVTLMQPFVLANGLKIFPTSFMDSSDLFIYQPLSKHFPFIDRLLDRVRSEELTFTVLFHPDHFGFRRERLIYAHLLDQAQRLGLEIVPLAVANARCH